LVNLKEKYAMLTLNNAICKREVLKSNVTNDGYLKVYKYLITQREDFLFAVYL